MPVTSRIDELRPQARPDWHLDGIVDELRQLRDASLAARQRLGCPAKLPSRNALAGFVDLVCAALFPNRLSARALADESVDYFVGHTLDRALRELVEQLAQEYRFNEGNAGDPMPRA